MNTNGNCCIDKTEQQGKPDGYRQNVQQDFTFPHATTPFFPRLRIWQRQTCVSTCG